MSDDLVKKLQFYERLAQQVTTAQAFSEQFTMANRILTSMPQAAVIEQAKQVMSFENRFPALFRLGQIQSALDNGAFKQWQDVEQSLQQMCKPFFPQDSL